MRLKRHLLKTPFINVRCVNIFNSEIYQPGNQIHLGYAVSHINLPNPHTQLEVFSTHITDEWHLEEMEALGFEPRTYGL